jgi:hypothetical protein
MDKDTYLDLLYEQNTLLATEQAEQAMLNQAVLAEQAKANAAIQVLRDAHTAKRTVERTRLAEIATLLGKT